MNYQHGYGWTRQLAPLALALMLGACASLPSADPAPKLAAVHNGDFVTTASGQWPAAGWWHDLHDAQLDQLIDQALKGSPSIAVAQARVQQAQSLTDVAAANRGIKLDANGSLSRTRYSANGLFPPPIAGSTLSDGELSLNFSYDFDFWGRNRKAMQAALGRETAARAEAEGAAASLSAAVASAYYQWQVLNQRIALQQQIAGYQQHLVEIETRRAKAGLTSRNTIEPLRANAAVPQETLVQLQEQRDQALAQLKTLVASGGDFPNLQPVPLPQLNGGVPGDLALDLIARRADIAAARDRVQASLSDVESARAAFYPDVNISALAGLSSIQLGKMFDSSSIQAGVTPAIHLPLFDAGRLRAGLDANRADVTLAVAEYNQSVQGAVGEINDAALRVQGADSEAGPLDHQTQARQHEADNAQRLVKAGLQDGRVLVGAQLAKASLDDQELARQGRALQAHIDLIKALGGGYLAPDADKTTAAQ